MRPVVFMFPGQSSRHVGLFEKLHSDSKNHGILERASDALSEDLTKTLSTHDEACYSSNRVVQLVVFLANYSNYCRLSEFGVVTGMSLGLSLGEYNHLVHIGALEFEDALRLVDARGRLYDDGPDGCMVSLFPAARETVEALISEVGHLGVVEISNDNSPSQFVVSGERAAVNRVAELFAEREFAEPAMIETRIPMHCSVFRPVAERFGEHLGAAAWRKPRHRYFPNVLGEPIYDAGPEDFVTCLTAHVHRPVLWRRSIDWTVQNHPDATFVEIGPRRVLCNLLSRKWIRNERVATSDTDLEAIAEAVLRPLSEAN